MSRLFGGKSKEAAGEVERKPHPPSPWIVEIDWRLFRVQCPICLSVNEGWWSDGAPRFSSGTVLCDIPQPDGTTSFQSQAACVCIRGQQRRKELRISTFPTLPLNTRYHTIPGAVVWVQGDSRPAPNLTRTVESLSEVSIACAPHWHQFEKGKISSRELHRRLSKIARESRVPEPQHRPTIDEILEDSALWDLYTNRRDNACDTSLEGGRDRQAKDS